MIVYRITSKKYADKLDGKGASLSNSNRWNSRGTEMLYTAESEALARAELSGHINLALLPNPVLLKISIPDNELYEVTDLPEGWDRVPPLSISKAVGDEMVRQTRYLGIKVPSRYDRQGFNYLLNPNFPGFEEKVKIVEIIALR